MKEFFEIYKSQFISTLLVVGAVLILRFLTNVLHKWLIRQEQKKFPGIRPKAVNLVKTDSKLSLVCIRSNGNILFIFR